MLTKITPYLGAEIPKLTNSELSSLSLKHLLAQHGVLYFPAANLSPLEQLKFAKTFGEPLQDHHPIFGVADGVPEVSVIVNDAEHPPNINVWHTDLTYRPTPAGTCVLQCIDSPEVGGDTLWSSMTAAYDALSEPMKAMIAPLRAEHRLSLDSVPIAQAKQVIDDPIVASHPLVRVIPETGRRSLFINRHYVHHIEGLTRIESRGVLAALCEHAESPDFQLRIKWQPGDIVVWDNRQTQHFAAADYFPAKRVMHRIALAGETPIPLNP